MAGALGPAAVAVGVRVAVAVVVVVAVVVPCGAVRSVEVATGGGALVVVLVGDVATGALLRVGVPGAGAGTADGSPVPALVGPAAGVCVEETGWAPGG